MVLRKIIQDEKIFKALIIILFINKANIHIDTLVNISEN